ncbi:MAG: hypothetical protein RSA84_22370, partial [Acinetobacter sp.]
VFLFLLFLLIGACGDTSDKSVGSANEKSSTVEIQMQADASSVVAASPLTFSEACMSVVNMCWYEIEKSFGDSDLPTVIVNKSLSLEHVANINITVDKDASTNVEDVQLSIRSLPDNSRHEEYQQFLYGLLDKVKAAGWRHYYSPSDPRISGSQMDKIKLPDEVMGDYVMSHPWLDPDYRLDLDRWLKFGSFHTWYFFKDDNYLTVQAWSRNSDKAPAERGTYLVSLHFTTQSEYWRAIFDKAEEKDQWSKLLPKKLKEYQAVREAREKKARAAGIEIDQSYQDPVIRALQ